MDRIQNKYYKTPRSNQHVEITCKCGCGKKRFVRTADVKRGLGKFYSKSCKAKFQARNPRNGQPKYKTPIQTVDGVEAGPDDVFTDQDHDDCMNSIEDYWDGHKGYFI